MIRVGIIWLLLLLSLLSVFKAPAYYLWLASVIVTEFPWIFVLITAFLLFWGLAINKHQLVAVVPGIIALTLFTLPVVQAYRVGSTLQQNFELAFGKGSTVMNAPAIKQPFSFLKMLAVWDHKAVPHQVLCYDTEYNLTLNYFPASVPGNRPCVIVVHGGSWSSGNSSELPELNTQLAKLGFNVASVNYRLAPQYQSPAQIQDVHSAFKYLRANAGRLNIDTSKFVLLGRSAGGQIALQAAYTLNEPGLKGVVGYYAPADMVWGYSIPSNPWVMNSRKVMSDYLGGSYNAVPHNYQASSPILAVNKKSVPTLLIHGQNDVLVAYEHSRRLNLKLQQLGVKHFLLTMPWAVHGCDYSLNGPGGQLTRFTVERFINQVTK